MLDRIRTALSWNIAAYDTIKRSLCPGMTEASLFRRIQETWREAAGASPPFAYDLLSGERCGEIGGEAGERVIRLGDCVIADLLVACGGGWCDTTRTFFVGEPSAQLREAYAALQAALRAGEARLGLGVRAGEIYDTVSSVLISSGFGELAHHAGHAVGQSQLDPPDFVRGCEEKLREGMVVTLEPGIYFSGRSGMRIENNYLITSGGCENLFGYPEEMEFFIIRDFEEERNDIE